MSEYRYILEPYKTPASRYDCPDCGKHKIFSRYLDTETGEHLNISVGRCNRESNCGYDYTPKQYFQDNNIKPEFPYQPLRARAECSVKLKTKPFSIIPFEPFEKSLQQYGENNFVKFLFGLFGAETTNGVIEKYFIGTSKKWDGATIFWQIDIAGKVRTGKIMLYSPDTGKRVKEPYNYIDWVHNALKLPEFSLQQCFFGEHLLKGNTKPIAIVESEKTALIASIYLPQLIWCAAGSLTDLKAEKCSELKGRNVILFPDLNGFEKWSDKAKELSQLFPGTSFNVSDLLESNATEIEKQQGLDLADYLIRYDYRKFEKEAQYEPQQQMSEPLRSMEGPPPQDSKQNKQINYFSKCELSKAKTWEPEIIELENYFDTAILPKKDVKLNPYTTIKNISSFIQSHLVVVKTNDGKSTFLPYLERLQELKKILLQ